MQLDINIWKLLKKCRERRFSEMGTLWSLQQREETSNYVNDTGLRSQKQNLRADYLINANNWKRILKCPCLHKSVPQDPPFHYCHFIPWWRSQLLLSQNSRLLCWFLDELFPAASVSQVTKTTQTSFNWWKK
jgi:hypothetical protein